MDYEEHLVKGAETCFVSFASMGEGDPNGCHFEWRAPLLSLGASVVLIRDPQYQWYQAGIGGIGDIATSAEYVRGLKRQCDRLITIGVSMGGFGALLFGILAGADEIIALAPQTILGDDPRWVDNWPLIKSMPHPDIVPLLPCASRISVFIGDSDERSLDLKHYERIAAHASLTIVPGCHHATLARVVRDKGYLAPYANSDPNSALRGDAS